MRKGRNPLMYRVGSVIENGGGSLLERTLVFVIVVGVSIAVLIGTALVAPFVFLVWIFDQLRGRVDNPDGKQ